MTNDIDWTKAPEGATHYDVSPDVYPWLKEDDNGNKFWYHDEWVRYSKSISETEGCIPKPLQPVFTKAMQDNGDRPQVGMRCLINFPDIDDAWYEYTIDFMGEHVFIATCKDVAERFGHIDDVYFKPVTPPIELIDGKAYQFEYNSTGYTGIYSDIDNNHKADVFVIIGGHVMASYCKSIKLLEVQS